MADRPSLEQRPDLELSHLAERNDGIVHIGELKALGLTSRQIDRRIERGTLNPLFRGVYAVGHRAITRRGRRIAALRAAGPEAILCGLSGAAHRGLSMREPAVIEICVPPTGRRDQPGLKLHHALLTDVERSSFRGLPVVSLARLMLELSSRVSPQMLGALIAEAAHMGMSARSLSEQLTKSAGHRGVRALREAADGYVGDQPTRSPPEAAFLQLCGRNGLPLPLVNVPIGDREVDFFWPDVGLIVEVDGFGPHRHRERFEGDRARAVELRVAGYEYLPFTPRQLEQRPQWVVGCVTEARARLLAA